MVRTGSLYYASDKALFDALKQHKISFDKLRELFLSRGILISKETSRSELAAAFSRLTHDYFDHQLLAQTLGTISRREKTTSKVVSTAADLSEVEKSCHKLRESIQAHGDNVAVNVVNGKVELIVNYRAIDYNRSEFKQVIEREAIITIEKNEDDWLVRHPLNQYATDVVDAFMTKLNERSDEDVTFEEVSLEHIDSHAKRTKFFTELTDSIPSLELVDVTDVDVYHPKIKSDSDALDGKDKELKGKTVHISKASLKGEGVLQSEEFNNLKNKGFYIWRMSWLCRLAGDPKSDHYEFEAQFIEPDVCRGFAYLVKGFYKYNSKSQHNKSKTHFSTSEESRLGKLIESTGRKVFHELTELVTDD